MKGNMVHYQLLKIIILKFNSSSIALLTMCISHCCHSRVLYWAYTDPYCSVYWAIEEKNRPSCLAHTQNQLSQYGPPRNNNTGSIILEIENVWKPSGFLLGISLVFRLYFTVYPCSCHSRDMEPHPAPPPCNFIMFAMVGCRGTITTEVTNWMCTEDLVWSIFIYFCWSYTQIGKVLIT